MKEFMNKDFLLKNDVSKRLYFEYSEKMPIFDYHCHLNPKEIAENKNYKNLAEIWLYGDHYKWRAMRSNGIDEKYITGDGSDYEKFLAFAKTLEYSYG
ncbi:MAG: glucuronate isomerase, partial [Cetobacterium sp.]|nr:glucuronate isomerase [Cetobacterium sp.]